MPIAQNNPHIETGVICPLAVALGRPRVINVRNGTDKNISMHYYSKYYRYLDANDIQKKVFNIVIL